VKQFLVTIAGVFVGLMLFLVGLPFVIAMLIASSAPSSEPSAAPDKAVLVVDLRFPLRDQPSPSPFASFNGELSSIEIVRRLEAAETDPKVKGVLVRASEFGMSPGAAEEVRLALKDFRASGKFVIAHAQGFEDPAGLAGVVPATAADEVWMQDGAHFSASGLTGGVLFFGGLFERFGLQPEFVRVGQYKNAVDQFTERDFTTAHREAETSLLEGMMASFVNQIAADRKLTPQAVRDLLDAAPLTARQAMQAKLVDKIGRPEDAEDAAMTRAGEGSELLDITAYEPTFPVTGPVIALIGGEGGIVTGPANSADPFSDDPGMISDAVSMALLEAAEDKDVKAVVFRVNSPGGSVTASDQIWAAVKRVRDAGKPVVVSMGDLAASGGYYVSAGADAIVALPSTITGSIGIFSGKLVVNEALNRNLGLNAAEVTVGGPFANAYSGVTPFSNSQRATLQAQMDAGYADFTSKVAQGRKLPIERVREIAQGRVWTGTQARQLGLVDEIGGLRAAIAKARTLAKIDPKDKIQLRRFPAEQTPFEAISSLFGASAQAARAAAGLSVLMGDEHVRALVAEVRAAREPAGLRAQEPFRVQ